MGHLLLEVLPLALGAAVSPVLLGLEILALSSPKSPVARGWAVALGSGLVLIAVALGASFLRHLPARSRHSATDALIDLLLAAVLLLLAARSWSKRPLPGEQNSSKMATKLASASAADFVVAGMIGMVVNVSSLVLFLPAMREISRSQLNSGARLVVIAVVIVITLLPVLLPAAILSILGKRADGALRAISGFVGSQAKQISIVIELVFAVYLTVKGIGEIG